MFQFRKATNQKQPTMPQSLAQPNNLVNAVMNSTLNPNYTQTLTIEDFKVELLQCRGLDEKFALFRNQFQSDPYMFDLGHTSQQVQVSQSQISAMASVQNQTTWTHLEMITILLRETSQSHLNQEQQPFMMNYSQLGMKPALADSIMHYTSQIQAILSLLISKLYSPQVLSEISQNSLSLPQRDILRNSLLTMSDWIFYILLNYGEKLKPGFMGFIRTRLSDFIIALSNSKGTNTLARSATSSKQLNISQSVPVSNLGLSQQVEDSKIFETSSDNISQSQGEITESLILSITIIAQALINLGSNTQVETNCQFILLPLAKLALVYHDTASEPLSKDSFVNLPLTQSLGPIVLNGANQDTTSTLSTMMLKLCHLKPQFNPKQTMSKGASPSTNVYSMPKSDKFVQILMQLITKLLHQAVTNYVREQGAAAHGKEVGNLHFAMVDIISDQTKKELEQMTSQNSQNDTMRFHTREAQISWIRLSLSVLTLAVDSIKVTTQFQSLSRKAFDLFKCVVYLVGHFNLSGYEEHFSSEEVKGDTVYDTIESSDTQCLISEAFQIFSQIGQSEFKQNIDEALNQFDELAGQMSYFEKVDSSFYMKTIYLSFLQRILEALPSTSIVQGFNQSMVDVNQSMIGNNSGFNEKTIRSMAQNLLKLFTSSYYSESRIKDIEPLDGLRNKESYKLIISKLRQIESKQSGSNTTSSQQISKQGALKVGWATAETNKVLAQQLCFEIIVSMVQNSQKVAEMCINTIAESLKGDIVYDQSNSKLYQTCKLAVAVMQKSLPRKGIHKSIFEILQGIFVQPKYTGDDGKPLPSQYKTWKLCRFFEKSETFKQIWELVYQKCKSHLAAKSQHSKSVDAYFKSIQVQSSKQQDIAEQVMKQSSPQIPPGMIRDATFTILRKFYMFGLTNIEVAKHMDAQMKDILKDTRDYEHSFELKIQICSTLMILKDRTFKQLDALLRFDALLKMIQEFIIQVDNKYGSEKNQHLSSARRAIEGVEQQLTWEQERDLKVRHIKALVGQCINLIANYIDYKESPLGSIALVIEAQEKNLPGPQALQLDLIIARTETFSFDEILGQLKKIVVSSNMYGGFFVEQLLRIFFFQRVEVQNLCLTKNMQPGELVFDPIGVQILDYILNFLVDVPPQMYLNGMPVVKSFVSFIHSRLNTIGVANQAELKLARFAKCLTVGGIKHIKKIMIYIREKEEANAEIGTVVSTQLKELMVKILGVLPRAPIYKEFFTFMREIFYYNKDMDEVDYNLAIDTLYIMNNLMKQSVLQQSEETYHKHSYLSDQGLQMSDYFMFSDLTPGVILHDSFIVPQDSFSISLLFKLNIAQIRAMQERQGGMTMDGSTLTMTFFQIIDKTNKPNYQPFSIVINVVNDHLQIYDYNEKIDENWHTLVVYFDCKRKGFGTSKEHQIKIYIDQLQRNVQTSTPLKHPFHKSHQHLLVYGCDARDIMSGVKPGMISMQISQQLLSQNISGNFVGGGGKLDLQQDFKSVNYFQGCLSLPMFFCKMETDKQSDNLQMIQFLIRSIAMKRAVGINTIEYIQIMKELSRSNSMLKDSQFGTFETLDQINEEIILIHQKAFSLDHLSAVHQVKPAQILDVLGGYQLLYPVFEKSMLSNLSGYQISDLWKLQFKVLRSFMQADPYQIKRLHKSKHLIESLKSCIIRGSKHGLNILTKDLLLEILNVVRDVHTNKYHEVLEDFYRDYMLKIILDESFCDMIVIDRIRNRRGKVFEDVVENLVSLYNEEETNAIAYRKARIGEFFTPGTSKEVYNKVFQLMIRYQNPDTIQQSKKLAYVLMKILITQSLTEKFIQLIEGIQQTGIEAKKPFQNFSKVTLLAKLKVLEGVIIDPSFDRTQGLVQVLRGTYRRDLMENHLNQSFSYKQDLQYRDEDFGVVEDDIIAITLRIIIELQYKLLNHSRPVRYNKNDIISDVPTSTKYEEEKPAFIANLYKLLSGNPRGIRMQKTVISLIISAISKSQRLIHPSGIKLKYNPQYLKECLKDRKNNNMLEVMRSKEFDKDIFGLAIRLFKWYDLETKLVFLDFYRQVIQEGCLDHNIGDFSTFKEKNFLSFLRDLQSSKQELYMISIVTVALQNSNEQQLQIRNFAEHIVSSIIKCYFNTSLQVDIEGALYDEEVNFLRTIKKLFLIMDPYEDTLLTVINDVLRYVQEVVNWVWSYVLHDSNRTNLNLKLILFLQLIEEIIMKKLALQNGNILQNEQLYEMMSRLIVIFEHTKILYFDYPNPQVIECNRRNTVAPGMLKQKETQYFREISFITGGPLRIFTSLLLQFLRKMRPMTEEQTISSESESEHEEEQKQPVHQQPHQQEKYQYFDLAVEIFRYFIFKQESQYIQEFRPVPTIEPPSAEKGNTQAPLFRMIYNPSTTKKNLYVLQPVDLTRQFIECYNDYNETKDTVSQTPGFLPLLLMNELYEIIKRKYALLNTTLEAAGPGLVDQRHHVLETLALLFDILRHGYMNEEFKESIGYMIITITDPRLKEEIYECLNPNRNSINTKRNLQPSQGHKLFFLGRCADFSLRDRYNMQDSMIIQSEESKQQLTQQLLYRANMQDNYFKRASETMQQTPEGGNLDFTNPSEMLKVNQEDNEQFNSMEQHIQKVEEKQKIEEMKDFTKLQDELITIFTQWYTYMHQYFTSKNKGNQALNEAEMLSNCKNLYIENKRIQSIMLAFRMITTEKFNHAHILSFSQREAFEINKIKSVFQVVPDKTSDSSERTKLEQQLPHVKQEQMGSSGGGGDNNPVGNTMQNSSSSSKFHLNLPIGGGGVGIMTSSGNNFTPMKLDFNQNNVQPMSARKPSGFNDSDSGFEFNTQPQNIANENSNEGKSSLYSQSQRPSKLQQSDTNMVSHFQYHTFDYYYSKQCYKKIIKRLFEDPDSLWYDNLEQIRLDYQEMKEIYDLANVLNPDLMIDPQNDNEESKDARRGTQIRQRGGAAVNPPSYKSRQYDHFVRQRRTHDMWGRMLLLKPDRKYKQSKFLISHKYFVHDTLKNLFAISLLEDADFSDYKQLLEYLEKKQKQQVDMQQQNQENPQQAQLPKPHSESFKRLRELLMSKIEQNDFLYTLFTNPEAFLNDQKHFKFNPLTKQMDPSLQAVVDVQLISVEGAQLGELYLSNSYLMFRSKPEQVNYEIKFAMKQDQIIQKKTKIWPINNLEQVFKRRFALMTQGIEIFTRDKKAYFFNMLTEASFNGFYNNFKGALTRHNKAQPSKRVDLVDDPKNEFKNRKIFDSWSTGEISTQEFLLLVNKYSGRSFNDFAQYPIFPWIVGDYNCSYDELRQKTEKNETDGFRDLLLNSAILSEKKLNYVKEQFAQSSQITEGEPLIYGDEPHHLKFGMSTRLFALSFLIRMQPFTDNFIKINNGLDNPDRIFYSFSDQWHSLLNDPQNNCELTPEFFYLPEIFRNHNLANLGRSRSNVPVNEVILPKWASNEHDFVRIQRELLESKHVAKQIRAWLDMLFGARQKDEGFYNVYFCYAYEDYVRENQESMQPHNVDTILEFMQVPQKLFAKPLFTIDKKTVGASMQINSQAIQFNMAAIEEEQEEVDGGDVYHPPTPSQPVTKQQQKILDRQAIVSAQYNKFNNKLTAAQLKQQQINMILNSRTAREGGGETVPKQPNQNGEFKSSSLIQKLLNYKLSQNQKKTENELRKIYECHKIDKPDDNQIFHMAFSQLNGRIFVFLADRETQQVQCVACRESFLQEELKSLKPLGGLRRPNLKGDYNTIFQLYGGGSFKDKQSQTATGYRHPLLFTCQNLDNSIKVFDLNIKKASQIVHVERKHNALVTAIKFSQDFKYFISGDADGVLCHYVRASGEDQPEIKEDQLMQNQMSASVLQASGQTPGKMLLPQQDNSSDKYFPFTLKYKFQDHSDSILSIDINYTLDMYVTASRDGTLAIRCLRSAALWKIIQLDKLAYPDMEVMCLKLSLHGYVVVMVRNTSKFFTFVFSINGDQLVSTQRENELFEFKYAQLTQSEDHLIMVFNMKTKKEQLSFDGVIRVSRLYDLEKDHKKDNLQQTFYQMIHDQSSGKKGGEDQRATANKMTHRSAAGQSENATGFSRTSMPPVQSFALSQDESKMNMYLSGGTIVCFDESRSNIIDQLDDFGLA